MLQDSELARRIDGRIQIRSGGLRLRWELNELVTADGHTARAVFTGTVRALPEANELKMLEEALLSGGSVASGADVVKHFAGAISMAARKYASQREAQALVGEEGRREMVVAVVEAARAVAFACGVEVIPPVQVDLDCPTLKRQQIEAMQRQAEQRRAADQVDHLRRSAELFNQFEAIRASTPGLSPGQVLSRMNLADQADVFRAILAASALTAGGATLWAVAGPHLVRIDGDESPRAELIAVPGDLGPLRSVRGDGCGGLLLGCRTGVLRVNPESPNEARRYHDPGVTSQLGFNSAIVRDGRIWAAHGEAGLVCWDENEPENPRKSVRPASGPIAGFAPRNLLLAGSNRLIFSSGPRMFVIGEDGSLTPMGEAADADVIAIISRSGWIITAHDDGKVCSWSADDLKLDSRQHRAGRVGAAGALPWLGDARILLATEEGPLICVGMDDELITQYASAYRGMRMVAGAADMVAGVSADRQRVVLWHTWDGRKPFADLHVYGPAKHRVADVAFA
ncbi:MAG: hypothetical protein ABSB74_17965 [Tepidisphaeraceae bacterium]